MDVGNVTPIETLKHINILTSNQIKENIDYFENNINVIQGWKNLLQHTENMIELQERFDKKMWQD